MKPEYIVYLVRLILCNEQVYTWLKKQAASSATPLDDIAVEVIHELLCPKP